MNIVNLAVGDDVRARTMQVERFYFDEAALLEQNEYQAWLELLAEDLVYTMPQREFADRRANHALDAVGAHGLHDTKATLARRATWLLGPPTPENPRPFRRYLVTNVRVMGESEAGIEAHSKFLLWQVRQPRKGRDIHRSPRRPAQGHERRAADRPAADSARRPDPAEGADDLLLSSPECLWTRWTDRGVGAGTGSAGARPSASSWSGAASVGTTAAAALRQYGFSARWSW